MNRKVLHSITAVISKNESSCDVFMEILSRITRNLVDLPTSSVPWYTVGCGK